MAEVNKFKQLRKIILNLKASLKGESHITRRNGMFCSKKVSR